MRESTEKCMRRDNYRNCRITQLLVRGYSVVVAKPGDLTEFLATHCKLSYAKM